MGAIDLLTEALKVVGITISKRPDWDQSKQDLYFKKLSRYNQLRVMDRRHRDDNEFLNCQDDLANFVRAYREELER